MKNHRRLDEDAPMFEKTRYLRRGMKTNNYKDLPRCTKGKMSYRTRKSAEQILQGSIRYKDRVHLSVYRCPKCPYWHLTSKPRRKPL